MSWDPVYRLIKRSPRGRVTTYGEFARALRLPEPHGSLQRRLLEAEGVKIVEKRVDMTLFGWSPRGTAGSTRGKRQSGQRAPRASRKRPLRGGRKRRR